MGIRGEGAHGGILVWGGCDCKKLASAYGTPLYVVDEGILLDRMKRYVASAARARTRVNVAYAGKAFLCGAMVRLVDAQGLWLDVVSAGELHLALMAGFPPGRIIFHGNNKTEDEIALGLEAGVGRFVVDGFDEIGRLQRLAERAGTRQAIQLRITPGISPRTHRAIQTGNVDSKFGFLVGTGDALTAIRLVLESNSIELLGFHCHIGSQISELGPFRAEAQIAAGFAWNAWRRTGFLAREINLGGGWGAGNGANGPSIEDYMGATIDAFTRAWMRSGEPGVSPTGVPVPRARRYWLPDLFFEPGRSITAEAGITLYTVGAIKHVPGKPPYVIVDGGMTDNPRPSLYGAEYRAVLAERVSERPRGTYRLAGRTCESGDIIAGSVALPAAEVGDLVAVFDTGAYNHSMSSNYNRLPRPPVVFVRDGTASLVIRRETYSDLEFLDLGLDQSTRRQAERAAAGADS